MHRVTQNKLQGDAFEEVFELQARLSGLYFEKNNLTARFIPGRRPIIIKSELDYKLINQLGCVGYFDCKSYANSFFDYSALNEKQVERAVHYNDWRVPSGFVVWFRSINIVVFFSGHAIMARGPRSRFVPAHGLTLGPFEKFDLKPLLSKNNPLFSPSPNSILHQSPLT